MTATVPYVKVESSDYQLPYINNFIQSRNPFTAQDLSASDFASFVCNNDTDSKTENWHVKPNTTSIPASDSAVIALQKLDMEPNPFEQSFLVSSTPSNSTMASSSKNISLLPPVSSIENPQKSSELDWSQSLRAGPLSPSMLFGPQPNIDKVVVKPQPFSMGTGFYSISSTQTNSASLNGVSHLYHRSSSNELTRPVVTGWAEPLGIDSKNIPGSNKRKSSDSSRSDWSVESDTSRRSSIDDADSIKMKSDITPDDKRKLFLERNRKAALKCRQRKKQWITNLQIKVDFLSQENESLQSQATNLREEIINLKTLLLAHKECPVAQANGVIGLDTLPQRLETMHSLLDGMYPQLKHSDRLFL